MCNPENGGCSVIGGAVPIQRNGTRRGAYLAGSYTMRTRTMVIRLVSVFVLSFPHG